MNETLTLQEDIRQPERGADVVLQRLVLPSSLKPYYDEDGVTLYHGDALEILPLLPQLDAIITDPPYGVDFGYDQHDDSPEAYAKQAVKWHAAMIATARRVAVSTGMKQAWAWPQPDWMLCWHKVFSVNRSPFGTNNFEPVLFYGKGALGDRQSDYFAATFTQDKLAAEHPCPKPLKYATQLISILTKEGQTVCDPFAGSGTMLLGAKETNRRAIGIEISERYCDLITRRLTQGVLWRQNNRI